MKKIKLAVAFVFFSTWMAAQNFTLYGDKTFGGNLLEDEVLITYIDTNKILLTCSSISDIYWDKTDPLCVANATDLWVIMMDTNFQIHWQKSVGGIGPEENYNVLVLPNSPYIFLGSGSGSDSSCEKTENRRGPAQGDYWICKMDTSGTILWDKTFGGVVSEADVNIVQLTGGDYVVAGKSNSIVGWDKTVANFGTFNIWIVKFDSLGNKLWDKVYGGSAGEALPTLMSEADGGFVMSAVTQSPVSGTITQPGIGGQDYYLTKIDSGGNVVWDKRYGGISGDVCYASIKTNDGGFLLGGNTGSPVSGDITEPSRGSGDIWLIKTDSLGNKQWEKRYGGNKNDRIDELAKAPGGGYWFSGITYSDSSYEVSENVYGGPQDYWIVKIDSVGNKLWDKQFGGDGGEYKTSFIVMPDSSIFLAGTSFDGQSAVKIDTSKGDGDIWIVHFKYSDVGTGLQENNNNSNGVKVWPNPATNQINIKCSNTTEKATLTMYDQTGQLVYKKERVLLNTQVNISQLTKGVYYLNAVGDKINKTVKVVKM